mmetsp:Transcript_45523/g.97599  ORF Transcript_45523/g.97599 Transcript_45523/m.97599 type:complete len:227 (-) Transcript_45523:264-944(-)|eukprot:CAMPEP_0206463974 /NCGR_PEP_ID=MMETSP0324_2-20121206/26936_1 /ASSEMBLY_ACC=CAM_ASM_000836 /TAXON_ID=2866 /ORGANISM="Crypthecodinium cohnii, Strain Seligo" /LENGTH=226 /DNA_ID=CAMNT_0053936509 /DNA_START=50 /DNA_END=730 /DNA_ORIENTATION=+
MPVKKKLTKAKRAKQPEEEPGQGSLLSGKAKELLPQALDLSRFGSSQAPTSEPAAPEPEDEEDDDAPEEVGTVRAGADYVAPQSEQGSSSKRKRQNRSDEADDGKTPASASSAEPGQAKSKYVWEEDENRKLLEMMRDQEATKKARRKGLDRIEKDGFVVMKADATLEGEGAGSAINFLTQELFHRRKRARTADDKFDRNSLGGKRTGAHLINPAAKAKSRGRRPQ